jgi:hypothetical protein
MVTKRIKLTISKMFPNTKMMLSVAWFVQKTPSTSRFSPSVTLTDVLLLLLLLLFPGDGTVEEEDPVSDAITLGFTIAQSPIPLHNASEIK